MNIFQIVIRWFLRLKWWFIFLPLAVALLAIFLTKNIDLRYRTDFTIYTGVVSNSGDNTGMSVGNSSDWNAINNSIQNIINTIRSKETLRQLSVRLYARLMIHGDPNADNIYIRAKHYRELLAITPPQVLKLIDKKSEDITVQNLLAYEKPLRDNFVYGLMNWSHPYFSFTALQDNLSIKRLDNSDILQVTYETNDPGIAYQTLLVLSEVFGNEYKKIQFSNTNNVIKYFEGELARIGKDLRLQEDSLTQYNVENRVINYDKQTEAIALLDKEFSMRAQEVYFDYNNTRAALAEIEGRLDDNLRSIKNNSEFLKRLNNVANINYDISKLRTFGLDSTDVKDNVSLNRLNKDLKSSEEDLRVFMDQYVTQKYTRDGYPNSKFVTQWIDELIKFKRAESEVKVVKEFQAELDQKYTQYSPIGSVLKRKERNINFIEQSYLSILSSLNEAKLRLKSLEMNSAVLKVINEPSFPLNSLPSKRKVIVAGAYFGTIILLFGFFLLLELLDRTLRDRLRTERLTKTRVVGAFPKAKLFKDKDVESKISHVVANSLYGFYNSDISLNMINVVTLAPFEDADKVTKMLNDYWCNLGINAKSFYEGKDFHANSREYLIGTDWKDKLDSYDLVFVQHAPLMNSVIPSFFIEKGLVTLVLLEADSIFNQEDENMLNGLKERLDNKNIVICLVNSSKYAVEEFTGLLPPYTFLRRLNYRLSNFGLTSRV